MNAEANDGNERDKPNEQPKMYLNVSQETWDVLMAGLFNGIAYDKNGDIASPGMQTPPYGYPWLPAGTPPWAGYGFFGMPPVDVRITYGNGTVSDANTSQYQFFMSQESIDFLNNPDEGAKLGQMAEDIMRSIEDISAQKMHEMLTTPSKTDTKATKTDTIVAEKPVRWKKEQRNRLKFYKWLREQGAFDTDIHPETTESITDVLKDVAEADIYVPPVPRLSDNGA